MLIFWRIRYLDTGDKQFKDRDLWLDTSTLDPVTRAAVELCHDIGHSGDRRGMLQYRCLFKECRNHKELQEQAIGCGRFSGISIHTYFEDENGGELTSNEVAAILTGNPTAFMLPAGARQCDIDYMLADKRPVQLDRISISQEQLVILGYFARDLREMLASAFFKDGPGTLTSVGNAVPTIQTAVTDEEIRSFVTIFRRLYMAKEPANFVKAVTIFGDVVTGFPLADWVKGVAAEYEEELDEKPDCVPFATRENWTFSRKRLIDVFLYTQYAHQPDERRCRQYRECLASVGGQSSLLVWLFFGEMWHCALHMRNAGVIIAEFYDRYCQHHKLAPGVLGSVSGDHPSIGTLEKHDARRARIVREKVEELAGAIWEEEGRPAGGPAQFAGQARRLLEQAIHKGDM